MFAFVSNIALDRMLLLENFYPRRPKLAGGNENRCFFVLDKEHDAFCWFGRARITAHGVNVFRRFVKDLSRAQPLKRASASLHLNFPFENVYDRMRIMPMDRASSSEVCSLLGRVLPCPPG